jgi:hypothetical protein
VILTCYPTKLQSGANWSFHSEWYARYDWLEYSQEADAAFCFACRHFSTANSGYSEMAFTTNGYSNWKKAHSTDKGFAAHMKSPGHVQAYVAWKDFSSKDTSNSIVNLLSDEHMRQVKENRQYMSAVVDVLKFTAINMLAQRGHDESADSIRQGNFLDLLHLLGKYNETVGQKLANIPGNAKYTSKDMQNELLALMAKMVQKNIADEVRESGEFCIMADETKDCRKIEQMSVVIRYFLKDAVYESFIGFIPISDLSADGLSSELISQMEKLGLDYRMKLVGQGYDGASVMSGKHAGVAALIKNKAPFASYVHCHAHRLNLVLVDCVKTVPQAAEFFVLLENLYVFVSGSFVHARWMEIQRQMFPNEQPRELQRLSDTRWACRYAACKSVRDRFPALLHLLHELEADRNAKRAVEARSLLCAIDFRFVLTLEFFCDILGKTYSLSVMLQSSTVDFCAAIDLLNVIRTDLTANRLNDEIYDKL